MSFTYTAVMPTGETHHAHNRSEFVALLKSLRAGIGPDESIQVRADVRDDHPIGDVQPAPARLCGAA